MRQTGIMHRNACWRVWCFGKSCKISRWMNSCLHDGGEGLFPSRDTSLGQCVILQGQTLCFTDLFWSVSSKVTVVSWLMLFPLTGSHRRRLSAGSCVAVQTSQMRYPVCLYVQLSSEQIGKSLCFSMLAESCSCDLLVWWSNPWKSSWYLMCLQYRVCHSSAVIMFSGRGTF